MCANFQLIGEFTFSKNLQMSSNFLHFLPKTEHLECSQFVESSFVQAAFSDSKFYLKRKNSLYCIFEFLVESFCLLAGFSI